jgi:GDPmannose 4,6-dehydratase
LVRVGDKAHLRPNEVNFLKGDAGRANKELGWGVSVTFDQLVARMVNHDVSLAIREAD